MQGLPAADDAPTTNATLISALESLRARMTQRERDLAHRIAAASPEYSQSARNLAHYLALREQDLRRLQSRLERIGTSSLGRSEPDVIANLDRVLDILRRLDGCTATDGKHDRSGHADCGRALLQRHTAALLGPAPPGRPVRIMVTLPSEAADDFGLVRSMVDAGMEVARINCAHDDAARWEAMAAQVRRAARDAGRPVRILMDLAGPKLRTGPIAPGPEVLKLKPSRDAFGRVLAPARIRLRGTGSLAIPGATAQAEVDARWLADLASGERLDLVDARGARRSLQVVARDGEGAIAEAARTAYLVPGTTLVRARGRPGQRSAQVGALPRKPGRIFLRRGDRLLLTAAGIGRPAEDRKDEGGLPAIACTLPEVFAQVCVGERVWFDDGRIGAVIRRVGAQALELEITSARPEGETLREDKGINLPDSRLELPALTDKDVEDLDAATRLADIVGLSFVQRAADVETLHARLAKAGAPQIGVLLKIETRRAFEHLPELMFAAMAGPAAGVMIARGDLAVECGYERLAEVQEEILWAAEAAHMPVVWATQVLETLAKTGQPSRAEITDAAMGERAECVMLNKGPHIVEAIRTLDDILGRMQTHQAKKRPLLRALGAWRRAAPAVR